jgi:hypothetical protein
MGVLEAFVRRGAEGALLAALYGCSWSAEHRGMVGVG